MITKTVKPVSLANIKAAQKRLAALKLHAPMVRLAAEAAGGEIYLKLENLQPVGSFKARPIGNAVLARPKASLARGIYTGSSGNSALAVAWMARRFGVPAAAVVPANAPEAKLSALRRLGARIRQVSFDEWWQCIEDWGHPDEEGLFIDAVRDPYSLAGDATVGVEILEALPDVEAILVPFGGGGLACGIACAVKAMRPEVKVIACELTSAHPLASAFQAGKPVNVPHEAGFVSGVGLGSVLPEMWPMIQGLIDGTVAVSLDEVAAAIKLMAERNKVIAEGAGAVSVAAALSGRGGYRKICAVVSGGNLDHDRLITILQGATPS